MEELADKLGEFMAFSVRQHIDQYPEMNRAKSWLDLWQFTDANEYIQWALWRNGLDYSAELNETINNAIVVAERLLFGSVSL